MEHLETIGYIVATVLGSEWLWKFIQSKSKKKTMEQKLLTGIGYKQIVDLCNYYISRYKKDKQGMTTNEYKELKHYLYEPYHDRGGNGTVDKLMSEVEKIPIKDQL